MPLGDLFKSQAQKQKEAQEAAERSAKEKREQAELNLFNKKCQLESKIKQLEGEKLQLGKQASELKDSASLSAYRAKSKELANHKLAITQIGTIETQLRGSTTGVDALGDLVATVRG
ncbi:MAG: hypothetical protein FWB78_01895 [Treponema sp.]|nr:hypothetical protein [Treponema sp.]